MWIKSVMFNEEQNIISHCFTMFFKPLFNIKWDIYGPSRIARKSLISSKGKLHTYIRPLVEAGKLLAPMEFAAHFRPYQQFGLFWPLSHSGLWKCSYLPLSPSLAQSAQLLETLLSFLSCCRSNSILFISGHQHPGSAHRLVG